MSKPKHDRLHQELIELKLGHVAENYRQVLDEAVRNNTPMLEILLQMIGG